MYILGTVHSKKLNKKLAIITTINISISGIITVRKRQEAWTTKVGNGWFQKAYYLEMGMAQIYNGWKKKLEK